MQCLTPITLKNENGVLSRFRVVPCGKCYICLQKRRHDWIFRISQELKVSSSAYFITLTYNDMNIPIDDNNNFTVSKVDFQLFMKRLRKRISPFKVRYFAVSEYGGKTLRPHYHLILFNFPNKEFDVLKMVSDSWNLGFVNVGKVNGARIAYVTKYCLQCDSVPDFLTPNFMLCSRRPAIGLNYLSEEVVTYHKDKLDSSVVLNGFRLRMPRYYKDKIFNEVERSMLSIKGSVLSSLSEKDYVLKYDGYDKQALSVFNPMMKTQIIENFSRKMFNQLKNDNL